MLPKKTLKACRCYALGMRHQLGTIFLCVLAHGAELVYSERLAAFAYPFLTEDGRTVVLQLQHYDKCQYERPKKEQCRCRPRDVDNSFDGSLSRIHRIMAIRHVNSLFLHLVMVHLSYI